MTFFVGTQVSSVYADPEMNHPSHIEYFLGVKIGRIAVFELALKARKSFELLTSVLDEGTPVIQEIIGTNDEDLKLYIQSELQNLGVDYYIEENYTFFEESIDTVDQEGNHLYTDELSVNAKYMFMLKSLDTKTYTEPVIANTGSVFKPKTNAKLFHYLANTDYEGGNIPHYFQEKPFNLFNIHYSNEYENEDIENTKSICAEKIILDVIGLTFDDYFYYFMLNKYEKAEAKMKSSNAIQSAPQPTNAVTSAGTQTSESSGIKTPYIWVIFAIIIVCAVLVRL